MLSKNKSDTTDYNHRNPLIGHPEKAKWCGRKRVSDWQELCSGERLTEWGPGKCSVDKNLLCHNRGDGYMTVCICQNAANFGWTLLYKSHLNKTNFFKIIIDPNSPFSSNKGSIFCQVTLFLSLLRSFCVWLNAGNFSYEWPFSLSIHFFTTIGAE